MAVTAAKVSYPGPRRRSGRGKRRLRGGRHRADPHDEGLLRNDPGVGIPTVVSLNSIMVDGTGMCGSCRVTVGGSMKFACVDGADFDGHLVNFDELALRQSASTRGEAGVRSVRDGSPPGGQSLRGTNGSKSARWRPAPSGTGGAHARSARSQKHPQHPAGSHAHAEQPAQERAIISGGQLGLDLEARCGGRPLPALQEAALCSRLPGGHRYPRLHPAIRIGHHAIVPHPEASQCHAGSLRAGLSAGIAMRVGVRGRQQAQPVAIGRLERFVADPHGPRLGRAWKAASTGKRRRHRGFGSLGPGLRGELTRQA